MTRLRPPGYRRGTLGQGDAKKQSLPIDVVTSLQTAGGVGFQPHIITRLGPVANRSVCCHPWIPDGQVKPSQDSKGSVLGATIIAVRYQPIRLLPRIA